MILGFQKANTRFDTAKFIEQGNHWLGAIIKSVDQVPSERGQVLKKAEVVKRLLDRLGPALADTNACYADAVDRQRKADEKMLADKCKEMPEFSEALKNAAAK